MEKRPFSAQENESPVETSTSKKRRSVQETFRDWINYRNRDMHPRDLNMPGALESSESQEAQDPTSKKKKRVRNWIKEKIAGKLVTKQPVEASRPAPPSAEMPWASILRGESTPNIPPVVPSIENTDTTGAPGMDLPQPLAEQQRPAPEQAASAPTNPEDKSKSSNKASAEAAPEDPNKPHEVALDHLSEGTQDIPLAASHEAPERPRTAATGSGSELPPTPPTATPEGPSQPNTPPPRPRNPSVRPPDFAPPFIPYDADAPNPAAMAAAPEAMPPVSTHIVDRTGGAGAAVAVGLAVNHLSKNRDREIRGDLSDQNRRLRTIEQNTANQPAPPRQYEAPLMPPTPYTTERTAAAQQPPTVEQRPASQVERPAPAVQVPERRLAAAPIVERPNTPSLPLPERLQSAPLPERVTYPNPQVRLEQRNSTDSKASSLKEILGNRTYEQIAPADRQQVADQVETLVNRQYENVRPEAVQQAVEKLAEKDVPLEGLYERQHELKDEDKPATALYQGGASQTTPFQSQPPSQQQGVSPLQMAYANMDARQSDDQKRQQARRLAQQDQYKSAVVSGFVTGIVIMAAILALYLVR